jgi:hypothetical protein
LSAHWTVQFKPSPAAAALLGAAHFAAAWTAWTALPAAAALVCVGGVALSLGTLVARILHRSRWSVLGLELRADGRAAWLGRDGIWHPVARIAGVALAPWLVVVALRDGTGRRLGLLVLPDAVEAVAMRRLRMWLRWRPAPAAGPVDGRAIVRETGEKPFGQLN